MHLLASENLPVDPMIVHYDNDNWPCLRFGILEESRKITRIYRSITHMSVIFDHASFKYSSIPKFSFVFQPHDVAIDLKSVGWDRKQHFQNLHIVPDLNYTLYNGFRDILPSHFPNWQDRKDKVFWRGSTTGVTEGCSDIISLQFRLKNCITLPFDRHMFLTLPRYTLCQEGKKLADFSDIGFYNVVQAINEEENQAIKDLLTAQNIFADKVSLQHHGLYRYIVQIGGNASSWGLLGKLRLGCCIFYVKGEWETWFDQYIQPWEHYIPIREDLSDFVEKVNWARSHEKEAETIARNAQKLGLSIKFEDEMNKAAVRLQEAFS